MYRRLRASRAPITLASAGAVLRLWDPNVQPAISDQWNLTVGTNSGRNTTLQVGFVGQVGNHLMVPFYYGQSITSPAVLKPSCTAPSPYFTANPALLNEISSTGGTVSGTQSNGRMTYNALQAVLQKTMSHGLQYQVSYTFGKCMSNNTGYYGTWSGSRASSTASPYWQNIYDPKAEWAPCYYDAANTLTAYAIYDLPFGRGRQFGKDMNKVADAIVGGWTVSPIVSLHSGFPLALYTNASDPTGTNSHSLPGLIATAPIPLRVAETPLLRKAVVSPGSILATIRTQRRPSEPAHLNSVTCAAPDTTTGISACRRTSRLRSASTAIPL